MPSDRPVSSGACGPDVRLETRNVDGPAGAGECPSVVDVLASCELIFAEIHGALDLAGSPVLDSETRARWLALAKTTLHGLEAALVPVLREQLEAARG